MPPGSVRLTPGQGCGTGPRPSRSERARQRRVAARRAPRSRRGSGATATPPCRSCRSPGMTIVRWRRWYTRWGIEYTSHDAAATRPIARVPTNSAPTVSDAERKVQRTEVANQVLVVAAVHRDPAPPEREVVVERARRELGLHAQRERAHCEDRQHESGHARQRRIRMFSGVGREVGESGGDR